MKTQFTPAFKPLMVLSRQIEDDYVIVEKDSGNFFARCYSSVDARLISAAPELLEALQGLMRAYGHPFTGENGNSGECWDKARAAIAQAIGGEV